MTNRRILVLSYEYPPLGGGGAKVVQGLATQLSAQGYEIDIVTMGFRGLPRNEVQGNIYIHRVPCVRLKQSMCYFPEMIPYILMAIPIALNLVRKNKYIVNHSHFILPDGVVCSTLRRLTGLPFVVTAHGSDVPGYNPDRFNFLHRLIKPFWKRVSGSASSIICPSEHIEKLVLAANPQAKTAVIPNAIEIDKFRQDLPPQRRMLVVTRMFERKGVQYFLRALQDVDHNYEINIVGDGPYLESLKQQAKENKQAVNFLGHLDNQGAELKEYYETSSIFVFSSESENFPIVLLEAMVAGMAIVTTRDTGCAEVVGDAALLVEPRNSEAIKRALEKLLSDDELRADLGRRARKRVEDNFGWLAIIEKTLTVYSTIVDGDN
jgi:glycosyltransferase involved in cell wall biosynthesis